jgi:ribosomal protein S18 acetylase RimI-like enzyme
MNRGEHADGSLRAAIPDDAQGIAAVHVATWRDAYAGLLPDEMLAGLDVGEWAGRWRDRLAAAAEDMITLVFEAEGRLRGFVSGGPTREEFPGGEVYAIYLDPGWQGRGAGRSLLAAATRLLADAGFTDASLRVLAGNRPARGFLRVPGLALRRHRDALDASGRQQRSRGPLHPDPPLNWLYFAPRY